MDSNTSSKVQKHQFSTILGEEITLKSEGGTILPNSSMSLKTNKM